MADAAFTQIRRSSDCGGYSIRTARWRYTLWCNGRRGEQLLEVGADPHETKNRTTNSSLASLVTELRRRVRAYADGAR